MLDRGRRLGPVALGDGLGQVLGEVADAAIRVFGSGEDALGVEAVAEPGDVQRLILVADGVECLVPGGQDLACIGIKATALRAAATRRTRAGCAALGGRPGAARRARLTTTARSVALNGR